MLGYIIRPKNVKSFILFQKFMLTFKVIECYEVYESF